MEHRQEHLVLNKATQTIDDLRARQFTINISKSALEPVHKLEFLGLNIDARLQHLSIPNDKRARYTATCDKIINTTEYHNTPFRTLRGQLGFVNLTEQQPGARLTDLYQAIQTA